MFGLSRLTAILTILGAPLLVLAQATKPVITAVANVASYSPGPIAPGEMILIGGTGMGPSQLTTLQLDANGNVATTLAGVQVLFDGAAAPLIYVSPTLVSAMTPFGLAGKASTNIQVVYQGNTSAPFAQQIASFAPSIFSADSSGKHQAAMTNSNGSFNSSTNPAAPGSFVTFYVTGVGQTNPPGADGVVITGIANLANSPTVQIAGIQAQVLYAGAAPGDVSGFGQFNVTIPSTLQYGGNFPLTVQIGNTVSQSEITVAVAGPAAPVAGVPQNPLATASASQIVVTWTATDNLASHFHVERSVGGGAFSEIAVVPRTTTTYSDQSVTAGVAYGYRILAESTYGFSGYSQVVSATVPTAQLPPAPTLQATPLSASQISLTWTATASGIVQFLIERATTSTGQYTQIAQPTATTTPLQIPVLPL
jgi:uncharacterized protein (TIGR03437 family)